MFVCVCVFFLLLFSFWHIKYVICVICKNCGIVSNSFFKRIGGSASPEQLTAADWSWRDLGRRYLHNKTRRCHKKKKTLPDLYTGHCCIHYPQCNVCITGGNLSDYMQLPVESQKSRVAYAVVLPNKYKHRLQRETLVELPFKALCLLLKGGSNVMQCNAM